MKCPLNRVCLNKAEAGENEQRQWGWFRAKRRAVHLQQGQAALHRQTEKKREKSTGMYRIRLDLGQKKKKVKSPLICEESDWMLVRGEIISKTRANSPVTSAQSLCWHCWLTSIHSIPIPSRDWDSADHVTYSKPIRCKQKLLQESFLMGKEACGMHIAFLLLRR